MGTDLGRRSHPRMELTGKIRFSFVAFQRNQDGEYEEDVSIIDVDVKDISVGGLRFVSAKPFIEGKSGYLFAIIEKKRFGLTGKIIHCNLIDDHYQTGMMFEKVENETGHLVPGEEILELVNRLERLLEQNPAYTNIIT